MSTSWKYKEINQLVDENYVAAYVLFYFGIRFYNYRGKTLEEVCREKDLDLSRVINLLETFDTGSKHRQLELENFPVELVIEYLKHAHHVFVKQKLPYLAGLITDLDTKGKHNSLCDLQLAFPDFVEDFIRHIYEEEDTIFSHILNLHKACRRRDLSRIYFLTEEFSMRDIALEHKYDEGDEMKSIREITANFSITVPEDFHTRVLMRELALFDEELNTHARVEDRVLFPKAINLEQDAIRLLRSFAMYN